MWQWLIHSFNLLPWFVFAKFVLWFLCLDFKCARNDKHSKIAADRFIFGLIIIFIAVNCSTIFPSWLLVNVIWLIWWMNYSAEKFCVDILIKVLCRQSIFLTNTFILEKKQYIEPKRHIAMPIYFILNFIEIKFYRKIVQYAIKYSLFFLSKF